MWVQSKLANSPQHTMKEGRKFNGQCFHAQRSLLTPNLIIMAPQGEWLSAPVLGGTQSSQRSHDSPKASGLGLRA